MTERYDCVVPFCTEYEGRSICRACGRIGRLITIGQCRLIDESVCDGRWSFSVSALQRVLVLVLAVSCQSSRAIEVVEE